MTTKLDFCTDLLLEHFNPAGPINKLSQTSKDFNRPFVKGKITQGFSINYRGRVRVNLEGIVLSSNSDNTKRSFSFECFEPNCFESPLEEVAIPISRICKQTVQITKVSTTNENNEKWTQETIKYINQPNLPDKELPLYKTREDLPEGLPIVTIEKRAISYTNQNKELVCDLDLNGIPIYYAVGEKDIENIIYFADFGYIDNLSKDFITVEQNIPFSFSNIDNVFSAISTEVLPQEIKAVKIKKLESGNLKEIGLVYGQLSDEFYFPHQKIEFSRDFTNQEVPLEDLSLNLLLFTSIKSTPNKPNRTLFRDLNYSSPEIESVIINSFETLSQLLNGDNTVPQYESIPKQFKTYTKSDDEYNYLADESYLLDDQSCFEDSCFDSTCFKDFENNKLIDRTVDNRAIAWCIIAFSSYIVNYSTDQYKDTVTSLMNYLLNQKSSKGLFFKGWDQTVEKEIYRNSLKLNTDEETSTNITIFLALLKTFEITQDFSYLLEASLLKDNIEQYLFNTFDTLKHNITNPKESIESSVYSLIYFYTLKDYTKITPTLKFLNNNIYIPETLDKFNNVIQDSALVKQNDDQVIINTSLDVENYNQLFTKTSRDTYNSSYEILKINYLTFSILNLISETFQVPLLDKLSTLLTEIEKRIITNREDATLIFTASCLLNNQSFLSIENNQFKSIIDLNNLIFSKNHLFELMLKTIPTEYAWLDKKVLNKQSNIGQILYTSAVQEALINCKKSYIKRMSSIYYMYGDLLTKKAADLGINRELKESDSTLKRKIANRLTYNGNNKEQIETHLSFYDTKSVIKDNYKLIQAFASEEESPFSVNWGEAYFNGTKKASNLLYTINIYQPLESEVRDFLFNILPSGVKAALNEIFESNINPEPVIGFRLKEVSEHFQSAVVNREIIEADKTLKATDEIYQYITTTAEGLTIFLPEYPPNGTRFVIKNKADSTHNLLINNGIEIFTLESEEILEFVYGDVKWMIMEKELI